MYIWILDNVSGMTILYSSISKLNINEHLVSGLISALNQFTISQFNDPIESIDMGGLRWIYILEEKYTSTNQAGNIIVTFSEDKEHEPTITPFANGATADMFIQLNEMVNQTILTAVRISNPTLLGIKTVQGLGSKDELKDAYEHFLATLIEPLQQKLNKEFRKVLFYKDKVNYEIVNIQNELFDDKVEITEE